MGVEHDEVLLLEDNMVSNPGEKRSEAPRVSAEPDRAGKIVAIDVTTSTYQADTTSDGTSRMWGHCEINLGSSYAPASDAALTRIAQEFPSSGNEPVPGRTHHERIEFENGEEPEIPETGDINLHHAVQSNDSGSGTRIDTKVYVYLKYDSGSRL